MNSIARTVKNGLKKHTPEILTGIGIAGMATTIVLAVKATPTAYEILEEYKEEEELEKVPVVEAVKQVWSLYISSAATFVAATTCIILATSVSRKRNTVLATACAMSEAALSEYKEKVVETFGEKKEKIVRDAIAKDKVEEKPVSKEKVSDTGDGLTLCLEPISGRYFYSDIDKIKRAINLTNEYMLRNSYASLNDIYDELNLKCSSLGDELGWNVEGGLIDLDLSSQLTDNDEPCLVIEFRNPPHPNYDLYL